MELVKKVAQLSLGGTLACIGIFTGLTILVVNKLFKR